MALSKLVFRAHAVRRMYERQISDADVRHVLESGETIENYPDDRPYPSRLILGWHGSRPIHVALADNLEENETIVITAYEPDPDKWTPDFKKRRKL